MKILITGSSGLIGSALVRTLQSNRVDVVGVDCRPASTTDTVHELSPDDPKLPVLLSRVTGIVHLAGVSRVVWGQRDPRRCWDANVRTTASLIDAAIGAPLQPWLIYASSREVYGQGTTLPLLDNASIAPLNIYAASKAAAEALVEQAVKLRGLRAGILRFSTVFGGLEDHADRVIPAFMRAALQGTTITVFGSKVALDPTWIDDTIDGVIRLVDSLSSGRPPVRPILLSHGVAVSLVELAAQICKRLQSPSQVVIGQPRSYDVERFAGLPDYAKEFLGWRTRVSLDDAITAYAELLGAPVEA